MGPGPNPGHAELKTDIAAVPGSPVAGERARYLTLTTTLPLARPDST